VFNRCRDVPFPPPSDVLSQQSLSRFSIAAVDQAQAFQPSERFADRDAAEAEIPSYVNLDQYSGMAQRSPCWVGTDGPSSSALGSTKG